MARKGSLVPFLKKHKYRGTPLIESMGGWLKKMLPLRGMPVVTYHKNWIYFLKLFGMEEAGTVEPKPGISPSPKHVADLVESMRKRKIRIILAANYFDEQKIRTVAKRTGAEAVIVPLYVGGAKGVDDYFALVDHWTDRLVRAAGKRGRGGNGEQ
jgi:ABC-type Zn uptake system ZnuABC Zn-binding protein ZnuA